MKFLVLGAGMQGFAVALDLARAAGVADVVLADLELARAESACGRLRALPECRARVHAQQLDVANEPNLRGRLAEFNVVVSAVPYFLNLILTRAAIDANVSFCDLGGNTDLVREQERLDERAKAAGVTIVPDCGLAPGMANVLAAAGIARLDRADSVRIRVGGLPLHPRPPLEYAIVFSMHGLLNEYLGHAAVIEGGKRVEVETLGGVEAIEFPRPVGRCEAFVTLGGASTMPWTYEGKVKSLDYKTVRYPGHAEKIRMLRDLGLLEKTPIVVDGVSVAPRSVFAAAAEPRLTFPGEPDVVVMRVAVEGVKGGKRRRIVFDMLDRMDERRGVTAMMRTTAYPTAAAALMIARGEVAFRGVAAMERALPAEAFAREVAKHELKIGRSESAVGAARGAGATRRPAAKRGAAAKRPTPKRPAAAKRLAAPRARASEAAGRARKPAGRKRR